MRTAPLLGSALRWVDRIWWSRVIRRADVVDLAFVRAQTGAALSARAAIRRYVSGGFRRGFGLNPLFEERTVSRQLPDAARVPALYAYLVNDRRDVAVSPAWNAPRYAQHVPAALADPGGPLGHAWRQAQQGGTIAFGPRGERVLEGRAALRAAYDAASTRTLPADAGERPVRPPTLSFLCRVGGTEPDADRAMAVAREIAEEEGADVVLSLEDPRADDLVLAALLVVSTPRLRAVVSEPGEEPLDALTGAEVTVVRAPGDDLDPQTVLTLAEQARKGPVAPLLLSEDGTVASAGIVSPAQGAAVHLLAGHPAEDAHALGESIPVSAIGAGTRAWPAATAGPPRTTLTHAARITRPLPPPAVGGVTLDADELLRPAGFALHPTAGRGVLRRLETAPTRWAIKTAAPAGRAGESWGDTHFARALASALRRRGVDAVIDAYPARARPSAVFDDVTLVIRGPHRIDPPEHGLSVLWIISHPDEITAEELDRFDIVFAASTPWSERAGARLGRSITPLLQCTDATRFHPSGAARDGGIVFVGTARGIPRPVVVEPLRAGVAVQVYGPDWRGYIPGSAIAGTHVPNDDLPRVYETASVVLNDHWPAMQRGGFVSNRLFDVVASGGRAISDAVEGIPQIFDGAVREYRSIPELLDLLDGDLDAVFPDDRTLAAVSARIRAEHSFDARAAVLCDAVAGVA